MRFLRRTKAILCNHWTECFRSIHNATRLKFSGISSTTVLLLSPILGGMCQYRLPAAPVQENNLSVFKSMLRTFEFSYTLLGKL